MRAELEEVEQSSITKPSDLLGADCVGGLA
jgi:hypothetical protein